MAKRSSYRAEIKKLARKYKAVLDTMNNGHFRMTLPNGNVVTCSYSPRASGTKKVQKELEEASR